MIASVRRPFGLSIVVLGLVTASACDRQPAPVAPTASLDGGSTAASGGASVLSQDLASLKRALAAFHDIDKAMAAGWDTQITPCLTLAGVGGQGFHYGNTDLIDGSITPLQPELLLYEPRGTRRHLTGVESIIPFAAWTDASPPSLYGETFHRNEALGLWVLHVWLWKPNPDGMFADWNPNVSCPGA